MHGRTRDIMTFKEQMDFTNHSNQFMRHFGIRITCLEEGCCRAELNVADYCRNTGTAVQGGLLYTMGDCAASAYARVVAEKPVTLNGNFHYLSNVTSGVIVAEAVPVRLGRTVLVFRVQVTAGDKLLAEGSFTCFARA